MSLEIVLVEDNAFNRELATDLLEAAGHRVTPAPDAKTFRALVRERPAPDIVLMDVFLPDESGTELAALVRADPRWSSVPVVAVTAHARSRSEAGTQASFDAILTKPIDTRTFVEDVERWARRRSQASR